MLETQAARAAAAAKVVVVDDSVSVCKAIERMLRPRGLHVVGLHSGEEALDRLEGEDPDLILCDLVLPDREGVEICRFVRASPRLKGVPLVVISGVATEEVRRRAAEAGADAVMKKPFRGEVLVSQIDALLGTGPAAARPAGPGPAEAARRVLAALERLPGLGAGAWRLAGGQEGRLAPTAGAGAPSSAAAPDPEAALGRLRSLATALGVATPTMLQLEGEAGEVLLVGQREGRGVLCLRLAAGATVGKARYLAGKFLRALDSASPSTHSDREEPLPWTI